MTARKPPAALSVVSMPENVEDLPPPKSGPYYVIDKKRIFIYKMTFFGPTLTPVRAIESLPEFKPVGQIFFTKVEMPIELVGKAWHFFRSIWNTRKSEAMVDITWHPEKGYRLFVPSQTASAGGVKATRVAEHYENRSITVGTIHSHCNFSASHSSVDTHDADEHDGLHITLGNVDKNPPSVAVMIASGGVRWADLKLEKFFGTNEIPYVDHPLWWNTKVEDPKAEPKSEYKSESKGWGHSMVPYRGGSENFRQGPSHRMAGESQRQYKKRIKAEREATRSLTLNRIYVPKNFMRKDGLLLEEIAGMTTLTAAQRNRITDMLVLLDEMDLISASLGLQLNYSMIEGSHLNNQEVLNEMLAARRGEPTNRRTHHPNTLEALYEQIAMEEAGL